MRILVGECILDKEELRRRLIFEEFKARMENNSLSPEKEERIIAEINKPPRIRESQSADDKKNKDSIRSIDEGRAEEIFSHFMGQYLVQEQTFAQLIQEICREKRIKASYFFDETKVAKQKFSNIKNVVEYVPEMSTVISIGVGLKLDVHVTMKLLNAAGLTFCPSRYRDIVYRYIVENCKYDTIPGFSEILKEHENRISAYNEILQNLGLHEHELLGDKRTDTR